MENVNVRSGFMVIDVGVGTEGVKWAVRALLDRQYWLFAATSPDDQVVRKGTHNSLQKSIALTPRAPSAGPTGSDGVAFPAGTTIFCGLYQLIFLTPRVDAV